MKKKNNLALPQSLQMLQEMIKLPNLLRVEDPETMRLREKLEGSLYEFLKYFWPVIEGGREFVGGWHIGAICEHLESCYYGATRNLLINVPPRTGKSTMISVAFPAWCWTRNPELQFLYVSYAEKLSLRDSVRCRRIIESPQYKKLFGHKFQLSSDVNTKGRFENNRSGYRIASSVGGTATGEGASILVCDDPNSAGDVQSRTMRESTNDWCDHVLSTRLNDPKTGCYITVMQRLHENDYSGHLLAKNDPSLTHLCLPMEYESARKSSTVCLPSSPDKPWQDPRSIEGELLWPQRVGKEELDRLKRGLRSEYVISGQLQQRPSPAEGGIIKKAWFPWRKERDLPVCKHILQSWDTAIATSETSCYSVCTTWGVFDNDANVAQLILLDLWRGKVEFPELRAMATELSEKTYAGKPVDMILVEAKANGTSLVQMLRKAGVLVTGFNPTPYGDKIGRVRLVTHLMESGRVWLKAKAPEFTFLEKSSEIFLEACALFPNAESNDVLDSTSQALIRLYHGGYLSHPKDQIFEEDLDWEIGSGKALY